MTHCLANEHSDLRTCTPTAVILLADPQSSFDYAVALTARHGLVVLVSQPEKGINLQFL